MKDFFEDFKSNIKDFIKAFKKKHGLLFGIGAGATLISLGAAIYFLVLGGDPTSASMCFAFGGLSGITSTFVGANGLSNLKKLKDLSNVSPENIEELESKYAKDHNTNVRKYAEVLSEKIDVENFAELTRINPFEDLTETEEVPQAYIDSVVNRAIDDANNTPIDIDI